MSNVGSANPLSLCEWGKKHAAELGHVDRLEECASEASDAPAKVR